jgi:hypothetical protein
MFRFALVGREKGALGLVVFAEQLKPGDVIPVGPGQHQRVLNVIPADSEDEYALLYVDVASATLRHREAP